jgi:Peptidase family M48
MSFLSGSVERNLLSQLSLQRRKGIALSLLRQFGRAFPEITYELLWQSPSVNAQAWRLGSARYVRVYGGLVRHQAITKYGLALVLAHETGHHLGGPPTDPAMPWLSWQGQADHTDSKSALQAAKTFARDARDKER